MPVLLDLLRRVATALNCLGRVNQEQVPFTHPQWLYKQIWGDMAG